MAIPDIEQRLSILDRNYTEMSLEISRLRQLLEDKEKLRPIFLESTPSNKAFGQMIEKVLDPVTSNTSLNMDVIGFVDNTLMEKLESCAGRIRIICHDQKKNPREVQSAISRLLNVGAEIRSYREMHARLVLTNTQAVIGSEIYRRIV